MNGVRLEKRELAEAVIEAASNVLREILAYPPTRGQIQITPIQFTRDDLTIVTRLSGDLAGEVFIGMSRETAVAVLGRMLKKDVDHIGTLEKSALSEIGSIITDTALGILEERGALCYSTWSSVVVGKEERATPFAMPTLAAPLRLVVGEVNLNVMLEGYAPFAWASPTARRSNLDQQTQVTPVPPDDTTTEDSVPLAA